MFGVIRFLDHPLLPANAPDSYPKIIKTGIDEEGQHPKSPPITAQCGLATLLYKMDRVDILEKLLDIENVPEFSMEVVSSYPTWNNIYVKRDKERIEIGFLNRERQYAMPGIRYRIDPPAEGYRFGPWEGLSTSDMGSRWAGPKSWIDAQGSDFAKSIWYNTYWNGTLADVSFTGKTPQFDAELETWRQEHDVVARAWEAQDNEEFAALKARVNEERGGNVSETKLDMAAVMLRYDELRRSCRAGCGVKGASMSCSKCRAVRYCSKDCQKDDWKYHKSVCGKEEPLT